MNATGIVEHVNYTPFVLAIILAGLITLTGILVIIGLIKQRREE